MKQRSSVMLDDIVAAPHGAVVLGFGDEKDGNGPWAYTRACLAIGIMRQREVHYPRTRDGFDRVGARLDWNDSVVPIHNMIVDETMDHELDEQTMICTPLTSLWEIQQKLGDYADESEREAYGVVILSALQRVGIYPQ